MFFVKTQKMAIEPLEEAWKNEPISELELVGVLFSNVKHVSKAENN